MGLVWPLEGYQRGNEIFLTVANRSILAEEINAAIDNQFPRVIKNMNLRATITRLAVLISIACHAIPVYLVLVY